MKRITNLGKLLLSKDVNESIIELDNFIGKVCNYGDEMDNLTEPQKLFYLNQNLEREVNNGGFHQYFLNSSGDFVHETIVSLSIIGASHTAKILQQAIDQFSGKIVPKRLENLLCASFRTSTTVKKDFEGQLLVKKEQAEFLRQQSFQRNWWVSEKPLEDMHDENIISYSNTLFFIDTVFYTITELPKPIS